MDDGDRFASADSRPREGAAVVPELTGGPFEGDAPEGPPKRAAGRKRRGAGATRRLRKKGQQKLGGMVPTKTTQRRRRAGAQSKGAAAGAKKVPQSTPRKPPLPVVTRGALTQNPAELARRKLVAAEDIVVTATSRPQLTRAFEILSEGLRFDAANAGIYRLRGMVQADLHQFRNAVRDFGKCLELDEGDHIARFHRALNLATLGPAFWDRALEDIGVIPSSSEVYYESVVVRAQLHKERGELEGALAAFDEAIHIDDECPVAFAGRAQVYTIMDNLPEALDDMHEAIRRHPDNPSYQGTLKDIYAAVEAADDVNGTLSAAPSEQNSLQ